jgi:hypothetical protein
VHYGLRAASGESLDACPWLFMVTGNNEAANQAYEIGLAPEMGQARPSRAFIEKHLREFPSAPASAPQPDMLETICGRPT